MPKRRHARDVGQAYCFRNCPSETLIISKEMLGNLVDFFWNRVREAGFSVVGKTDNWYEEGGAYLVTIHIEESGVTIWTWPEHGDAVIIINYCNFSRDNTDKEKKLAAMLKGFFKPKRVERGGWEFFHPRNRKNRR